MSQPCVKFLSHTISYMIFILMLVLSSIKYYQETKCAISFSSLLGKSLYANFTTYFKKDSLKYKFNSEDFILRVDQPDEMGVIMTIWIAG